MFIQLLFMIEKFSSDTSVVKLKKIYETLKNLFNK